MKKNQSVLTAYIDTSPLPLLLATITNQCIKALPEKCDETPKGYIHFEKYMSLFFRHDHGIIQTVKPINEITRDLFEESFKLFISYLPIIKVGDKDQSITSGSALSFDKRINRDLSQTIFGQLIIRTITELTIAYFLKGRTLQKNSTNFPEIKTVLSIIDDYLSSDVDENYLLGHIAPAKVMAKVVSQYSIEAPDDFAKDLVQRLSTCKNLTSNQLYILMCIYSEVRLPDNYTIKANQLEILLDALLKQVKKLKPHKRITEKVYIFLNNYLTQLIVRDPSLSNGNLILKISNYAKDICKTKDYYGAAHTLHAALYNISTHKKMAAKFIDYCQKYIDPGITNVNYGSEILKQIIIFLRGKNYDVPLIIEKGVSYSWKPIESRSDQKFIDYVFNLVISHPATFIHAQHDVADFLCQYCSLNKEEFFKKEKIQQLLTFGLQNEEAIGLFVKRLLTPNSGIEMDPDLVSSTFGNAIITTITNRSRVKMDKRQAISGWTSALDSFRSVRRDADRLLLEFDQDSYPRPAPPLTVKIAMIQFNRLKKILGNDNCEYDILNSIDTDLQFTLNSAEADEALNANVCAAVLLPSDQIPISQISDVFTAVSLRNSIVAIRALESVVCKYKNADDVIKQVFQGIVKINGCSPENVFRTVLAIKQIIDICEDFHIELSKHTQKYIKILTIIGLCSSSTHVRNLTLVLGRKMKENTLIKLINKFEPQISKTALSAVAKYIRNRFVPKISMQISFTDVCTSDLGYVYMFYLAALGQAISTHSSQSFCEHMHEAIIQVLKHDVDNGADSMLIKNLIILLINSTTPDLFTKERFATLKLLLHRFSRCNEEAAKAPHAALYSQIKFAETHNVYDLNQKDAWALYSISFGTMLLTSKQKFKEHISEPGYTDFFFMNLDKLTNHIYNIGVVGEKTRNFSLFSTLPYLTCFVTNVLLSLKQILSAYSQRSLVYHKSPFLIKPTCHPININAHMWQSYVLEMLDSPVREPAMEVLSLLLFTTAPEPDIRAKIDEKMDEMSPNVNNKIILGSIESLPIFIKYAIERNVPDIARMYFDSIAMIFQSFNSSGTWFAKWKKSAESNSVPEMTTIIYNNCGALLALSLAYLADTDSTREDRLLAFSLLANVALGSVAVIGKTKAFKTLLNECDILRVAICSQHTKLCGGAIIHMSQILAHTHKFAGEQFVYTMMDCIMKWPRRLSLTKILNPWLVHISLEPGSQVFRKSDPEFHMFTPLSFCVKATNLPPSTDVFDTIGCIAAAQEPGTPDIIEMLMVTLVFKEQEIIELEMHSEMILAIMGRWPQRASAVLKNFFSYKAHFYASHSLADAIEEQETLFNTLLGMMSVATFIPPALEPYILATCTVCINYYEAVAQNLMARIAPEISQDTQLTNVNIDKEVYGLECLSWGCTLGDLDAAVRGLAFYNDVLQPINEGIIQAVARSVESVSLALYEVKKENDSAVSYIAIGLLVLANTIKKLDNNNSNYCGIFWMTLSLLKSPYSEINDAALELIEVILGHRPSLTALKDDKPPENFKGVLEYLSNAVYSDEMIPTLVDIFRLLCKAPELVCERGAEVLTLLLIPLDDMHPSSSRHFFTKIAKHLDGDLSAMIAKLATVEPSTAQILHSRIIGDISQNLPIELINSIITTFDTIKIAGAVKSSQLYLACAVMANALPSIEDTKMALIAREAAADNEPENASAKNLFLDIVNRKGGRVAEDAPRVATGFPPVTRLPAPSFQLWDVDDVEHFPPLAVANEEFGECQSVLAARLDAANVQVHPFNDWARDLYRMDDIGAVLGDVFKDALYDGYFLADLERGEVADKEAEEEEREEKPFDIGMDSFIEGTDSILSL